MRGRMPSGRERGVGDGTERGVGGQLRGVGGQEAWGRRLWMVEEVGGRGAVVGEGEGEGERERVREGVEVGSLALGWVV